MRLRTLTTLIPLLSCCLTATALAQNSPTQDRSLKILPIADMLVRSGPVRNPRLGILTRRRRDEGDDEYNLLSTADAFVALDSDSLLELIKNSVGEAADELTLMLSNRTLIVAGKADTVAKTKAVVEALRQALTQRIAVHARLYRIQASDEFPAAANPARLRSLTKNLPLLWSAHSTALSGQQVALSQERYTSYTTDVDVEVAEEAKIGDPETTTMFEGIRLVVEPHALIGSTDRVFKCQFAIGEKEKDIEDLSIGVDGLPHIGIPHLRASSGAFSGRVASEGALLLSMQSRGDAGSNLLLVVQASKVGLPLGSEVSAGRTLLLPVSGMTSRSLRGDPPLRSYAENDREGARSGYPVVSAEREQAEDLGDMLVNLLRESLGELLDQDDAAIDLTNNGHGSGYILVHGSEQVRTRARNLLITMQDHWLRTTEIKLRTRLRAAPMTTATFAEIQPTTEPGTTYHAITMPSLHGHTALVMKGVESAVIQDFDVEIAQKASISNPVVHTTFSGITAYFRGARQGADYGGELSVDLQYLAEPRRQPTGRGDGGDIYHVRVHQAHFHHNGRISFDESIPMGYGPRLRDEPKGARMHQTVRFHALRPD